MAIIVSNVSEMEDRNMKTTMFLVLQILREKHGIPYSAIVAELKERVKKLQERDFNFSVNFPSVNCDGLKALIDNWKRLGIIFAKQNGCAKKGERIYITELGRTCFSSLVRNGVSPAARSLWR